MSEHTYTRRDGSRMAWGGPHGDICTQCERVFAGAVAFDRHLRRPQRGGTSVHMDPEAVGLEPDGTGKWRLPLRYPDLPQCVTSPREVLVTPGGAA